MAIAYGGATSNAHTAFGTSEITLTAPTISGSNTLLILVGYVNTGSIRTVQTVTYNSVSIAADTLFTGFYQNYVQVHAWYVKNPVSAAQFAVSYNSAAGTPFANLHAIYYTGVDQTTSVRTASTASGTTNPATVDSTNSQVNDVVAILTGLNDTSDADGLTQARMGAGQTFRFRELTYVPDIQSAHCDEPGSGGTTTHSWDFVNNADNGFVIAAVPLIPAAGVSTYTLTATYGSFGV